MITTSRYASDKTRKIAKKLSGKLGTFFASRGKKTIEELVEYARKKGETELMVVEENEGTAAYVSTIEISETGKWTWKKRTELRECKEHEN